MRNAERSRFPSPLWGGVRGGGQSWQTRFTQQRLPPSPTLPQPAAGLPASGKTKCARTPAGRGSVGGGSTPCLGRTQGPIPELRSVTP